MRGLVDRDGRSFSDPQVFLFLWDTKVGSWSKTPYAKTERIKDTLNPVFVNAIQIDYRFETEQRLRFAVYDIDDKNSDKFSDQDYLGEATVDLASIVTARGGQIGLNLTHPRFKFIASMGTIIIQAEELKSSKHVFSFSIKANDLTKKGFFKTRPSAFFIVERGNENGTYSPVYRSKVREDDDDPIWDPFSIKESVLNNGDPNRSLRIQVMSHKENGTHTIIGTTPVFTTADLSRYSFPHTVPIPPMTGTSSLTITNFSITTPPSFMDFMIAGGTIGLIVAIDFTQSNGDPQNPSSLHFKSPTGDNEYTRAIRSVGNILQFYDSDKKFPVYGFGGRIQGQVNHAFPLNGNPSNPEVNGVEGILNAYWNAHSFVELWGPTNFTPVISEATTIAKNSEPYNYTVLLILTDGAITDMNDTISAIQKASKHAISIIIVGVGKAEFGKMDALDGDVETSSVRSKKSRDIVQFVAARDFPPHLEYGLAQALLAELPDQFVAYMTINNIKPPPVVLGSVPMPMVPAIPAAGSHMVDTVPTHPMIAPGRYPPSTIYPPPFMSGASGYAPGYPSPAGPPRPDFYPSRSPSPVFRAYGTSPPTHINHPRYPPQFQPEPHRYPHGQHLYHPSASGAYSSPPSHYPFQRPSPYPPHYPQHPLQPQPHQPSPSGIHAYPQPRQPSPSLNHEPLPPTQQPVTVTSHENSAQSLQQPRAPGAPQTALPSDEANGKH
ncbi:Copine-8 [Lobosporangium transversale]|nr:Copine-8 [Lobosporangium transversale]